MTFRCGHPKTDANSYFLPKRVCKVCHTRRTTEWRQRNLEYYRAWNRRYYRLRYCDRLTRAWRGVTT